MSPRPPREASRSARSSRNVRDELAAARREHREARRRVRAHDRDEIRRFTAHLRRRRIALLASISSVVGLAIFVGVGVFSPVMAITQITVSGTYRVDPTVITSSLAGQIGRPLPLVDISLVESTLAMQPLVKSYEIQSLPPHTLVINIVERSPLGYLSTPHGYALVDPAGVTIEMTSQQTPGFPLIDVAGGSPTSAGFPAAVSVLRALPDTLRNQVATIRASSLDNVEFTLTTASERVMWGDASQSELKARVFESLLANYPAGSVSLYDVSSPGSAVVK